jgi:hypothetical protein
MKKILLVLVALIATMAAEAKIIMISHAFESKVYTSTQLSSIEFNDDGTVSIYDYNGALLEKVNLDFYDLTIGDEEKVFNTVTRTISTADMLEKIQDESYKGLLEIVSSELGMDMETMIATLGKVMPNTTPRKVQQIMFYYPTVDPYGNPVTQSACITIPMNIVRGQARSEGIILYHNTTNSKSTEIPSNGNIMMEPMILANPMQPNYILVEPDLYGFGATERFPQAFIQGDANGQPNIDCLLAAERILKKRGIDRGKLTFNAGYSSGGYEALIAQKTRDMKYADQVSFDKTFAGGAPTDIALAYSQMAETDTCGFNSVLPMVMVGTNETQKLGLSYEDMFQPWFYELLDEYLLSKKHSMMEMESMLWRKRVHDFVKPTYMDLTTPQSQQLMQAVEGLRVENGWEPDPSQNMFIIHMTDDDTVPLACAQNLVSFLMSNGYTPSTLPFQTNLEVNLSSASNMPFLTHVGGLFNFFIQFLAEVIAWPEMYINGQLNPGYQDLVNADFTNPAVLVNVMETLGIDVRSMVYQIIAGLEANGQEVTVANVMAVLNQQLTEQGVDLITLSAMLQAAGIDLNSALTSVIAYLIDEYNNNNDQLRAPALRAAKVETPVNQYKQQMSDWLAPLMNVLKK